MWITQGEGKESRRVRRAMPSSNATVAFQWGRGEAVSCAAMDLISRGALPRGLCSGIVRSSILRVGVCMFVCLGVTGGERATGKANCGFLYYRNVDARGSRRFLDSVVMLDPQKLRLFELPFLDARGRSSVASTNVNPTVIR